MDDETDTGAYNPDLADTGVSGGTQTQGDDSMDALPTPPDEGSRKEAKSWWRSIMDAARQQFGIADANANAPTEGAEPAGLPQQAGDEEQGEQPGQPDEHEPAGLPVQAGDDSASFDRKTGTAGGMRTRPTQPTMVGPDAEPEVPGQALKNQTAALAKAGEFLFADRPPTGPEDPEAAGYGGQQPGMPQRIIQYLTGHGAEDNAATKAREQETEAQLPPGTDKNTVREEALKQNAAKSGTPSEGVLAQWQAYKAQYNKYKALAGAAQDHGDNEAAAQLFNEAHTYLPNGVKVTASPGSNGGMNIHISDPTGGNLPPDKDIPLTGEQFRELTHMRVGEFDHVLERGIANNLEDLAKTPGMSTAPGQQAQAQPQAPGQQAAAPQQNKPGRDQSPEARANRVYPWISQGKQRELLAEKYRQEDQKEKNTTRTLDIREKESDRKRDYGSENLGIKREAIAQRDRHLGYLIDKSSGELNERMLHNLDRANGANMSNAVRSIDANIRAGNPLTDSDKAVLDRARSLAMTPTSRPSTLNGGGQTPPASGRGVAPPPGSTAPPPGQDPRGRWQINTATQQRRWVPYQQ